MKKKPETEEMPNRVNELLDVLMPKVAIPSRADIQGKLAERDHTTIEVFLAGQVAGYAYTAKRPIENILGKAREILAMMEKK